jgi:hypothetical protein
MTLAQIKAAVNARLADFWPKVKAKEETYAGNHGGRYWQGIIFGTPPDDGALCVANYAVKPTDQNTSWSDVSAASDLPASVEAALQIDVYQAPGGIFGYYCTAYVTKAGVTYTRTAQVEAGVEITTGTWSA